ncbi:MAG: hypothetical protein ACRDA0_06475 [Cetobacterium sp.]|uniref:hypothetical protein n=1 Tax=Cetobacterium sp. TaxID=2071632 RepID=UPI003F346EA6
MEITSKSYLSSCEPAQKVWIQIALATFTNFVVTAALGIPIILGIAARKRKYSNLKIED